MQQISHDTPVGHTVTGRKKKVTSYRTWLFSGGWPRFDGWPAKNVHTDLAAARQSGLPTRAASGAMCLGYLSELLVDIFGDRWLTYGELTSKFIGIIDAGDDIVSKALGYRGSRNRIGRPSLARRVVREPGRHAGRRRHGKRPGGVMLVLYAAARDLGSATARSSLRRNACPVLDTGPVCMGNKKMDSGFRRNDGRMLVDRIAITG